MSKIETFQQFLTRQSVQISLIEFAVNLFVAVILSYILGRMYVRYGKSLSNRSQSAANFVLIAMTTMLIITVVKSSLALSLGLVGALSIVRFRAAIKEPEELAYLFLTIAIGLGLGANQLLITLVAFAIIAAVIVLRSRSTPAEDHNLFLSVSSQGRDILSLDSIVKTLKDHCKGVNLRRFEETDQIVEASFLVEFDDFAQVQQSTEGLRKLNDSVKIVFLDNKGMA